MLACSQAKLILCVSLEVSILVYLFLNHIYAVLNRFRSKLVYIRYLDTRLYDLDSIGYILSRCIGNANKAAGK